jgi:CIC family chloride channel protein
MFRLLPQLLYKFNQYRKRTLSNRNFLIIAAVIVGIFGGLAAAILKLATHHIASFLQDDFHWRYKYFLYLFFPSIGILLSVIYVKRFIRKGKFETGLTQILYNISQKSSRMERHNIYSQIITSALTVGFGGSTGLEAPIVTSGSAIGSRIGLFFGLNYRETTMLLACGAAAGIAGAFNSPIAGIIFAIEILLPEFSIPAFIPLLMSAATASVIARLVYSEQLFFLATEGWETKAILFYIVLAALIGVFSIFFTKTTYWIKGSFKKISNTYNKIFIGGLLLGGLIFVFPTLYGEGYITIKQLLAGNYHVILTNSMFSEYSDIPLFLILFTVITVLAKSLATLITLSAGGNGGIFGPSLVMGGLLGFIYAFAINQTGIVQLNVPNFIVAGMAAALSGIMHAPLTGIFLIAEITGGYILMVPLMIVSAISYFISRASQKYSIYTKPLAEKGELLSYEDKDKTVLNMMRLKYVLDKNYLALPANEYLKDYKTRILQSNRNIFPVLDDENNLTGTVDSEKLFKIMLDQDDQKVLIGDLAEVPPYIVKVNESMKNVISTMDKNELWILPVINNQRKFIGFVSKTTIFNKYRSLLIRQDAYLK